MLARRPFCYLLGTLALGITNPLFSEEATKETNEHRMQFLANDQLIGWTAHNCTYEVKDGVLRTTSGDGLIRTDYRYGDFVLELEYRPLQASKYDAGIYIRSELPKPGQKWPDRHQMNLLEGGELTLLGFRDAVVKDLVRPKEWNKIRLTVVGNKASLQVNDKQAWEVTGLETIDGYIGFQVESTIGGAFEYRNLAITELGFANMLSGNSAVPEQWEGATDSAEKCWKMEQNDLVCTGQTGPWLRSKKEYGNFAMRLEYKLRDGGNSGVYARVPEDGNHHGDGAGVEIQILDDNSARYKTLMPYQYCGSVYAIRPADPRVCKPVGEWNTMEIRCVGTRYTITHNGVVVVNADDKDVPELAKRRLSGKLGLQNHQEEVRFRNVRIQSIE
ncbi:MAG: 3-keto-disaccharide hydrolase [Planctomycetaceae bacterium]